jgi:formimidoylglutamate deiminase
MHSGFAVQRQGGGLRADQRRFASTPDSVLRIAQAVNAMALPHVNAGLALHSLRAVDPSALKEASAAAAHHGWPVHIHIAEQTQEVDDCIAHHGQRPVEWLLNHAAVDARWNLVHATHTHPQELAGIQAAGASVVLCPSTEANLGDGVFDLPTHLQLKAAWSIGSDSHVTRRLGEELRLLEYSQRFARRQRNVAARAGNADSTAATLFNSALQGGRAASGLPLGGLVAGQRADFCLLDAAAPALAGMPAEHLLDAWVFSSPDAACPAHCVGGRAVPIIQAGWQAGLAETMRTIWAS